MIVDIGKNQSRAVLFRAASITADENRNSNAVDDFCVSKIDDERTMAGIARCRLHSRSMSFTAQFVR